MNRFTSNINFDILSIYCNIIIIKTFSIKRLLGILKMEIAPLNKLLLSVIVIHLPFLRLWVHLSFIIIVIYLFYYFSLFINRRKRESFFRCLVQSVLHDEVQPWREYSALQQKTIHLMSKWKHLQRKWRRKKAGIISLIHWLLTNALALDFLWLFLHSIASIG